MAAKIDHEMTFDDMEDEVVYTRAALRADPDARDLLPLTDGWMPAVESGRASAREARIAVATAAAERRIANVRLDTACTTFGNELKLEVNNNFDSARWKRFFSGIGGMVSRFIRIPFAEQVSRVQGWLTHTGDALLERHREPLTTWSTAAAASIAATKATAQVRGDAAVEREELADLLTRGRDGLEAALVERANERGLPREWPKSFFRVRTSSKAKKKGDGGGDDQGE